MDKNQADSKNDPVFLKSPHAEREERILAKWNKENTFQKSLEKSSPKGQFTFYDGPPFATGTPHYGHILAGTIKDVIPRWKTMQGYNVKRKWGWDCHGLPVENLIEKELSLGTKKDILEFGVGKFNEAAKMSVMRYANDWREIVPRLGRWVDMENDYRTMDASYTETVWWIFKTLYDKGLIYEGFKSMNICPRCETTLSNFEVAQGYKDITDISVFVKFRLKGKRYGGDSSFLAWTTTPWTLPGNVALAVNPEIEYVKIKISGSEDQKNGQFILAKDRLSILKDAKYEILETIKGSDLVGEEYEPMFDYYSRDRELMDRVNGWKVYAGDFVTTEDGTGIVHIAPAFGSDDYDLLTKHNLPFVQHVTTDGKFKKEVTDFAGMSVKPIDTAEDKSAHQKADIEVIKWLAHHEVLFEKEKLVHSYPHCWRCDTPLLNYAASSWFVKVSSIKDTAVKENEKITWIPPEIGEGRFGNWLKGARDWAISRSRFWGAPIPVWKEGKNTIVIGSVADLKKYSHSSNTYYAIRHGEAENNSREIVSSKADDQHHLTEKGKQQVEEAAKELSKIKFDIVYVSPFLRTRETVKVLQEKMGWQDSEIIIDERLRELECGTWNGRKVSEFVNEFSHADRFEVGPEGGETYAAVRRRMGDFIYDIEKKHKDKNILIVSHETPIFLLLSLIKGLSKKEIQAKGMAYKSIENAKLLKVDFVPLPHNSEYELDLHRPYIDDIELVSRSGERLQRVADVFDCWFESGSMPYGQSHYPFENLGEFDPKPGLFRKPRGYPADFIAEGLDQTRGWFYSMLILGVALFGKTPYRKVIVNGLVLAEDGQKMSKKLKNYPDPKKILDVYGADALRYYLLASPVVHGQDLCFSEKGVDEVVKKVINRLLNVLSFYEMYGRSDIRASAKSDNVLDVWIMSRLNGTISEVNSGLESGELDRAARPFGDFVEDISTWYLRRSRDRFKSDDKEVSEKALETTKFVLLEFAKLLAPFMPFLAEEIYLRLGGEKESVHLESWPSAQKIRREILDDMLTVRDVASKGLEARMNTKINVRQPLSTLKVKGPSLEEKFVELIKDEVNVKDVIFDPELEQDTILDTNISPALKEEGEFRELLRKIQDERKAKGLKVGKIARLTVLKKDEELARKFTNEIKKTASISEINFGEEFSIDV